MKSCAECGRRRVPDASQGGSYGIAVPFWLWLLPVPILSALLTKGCGPSFCSDGCKRSYCNAHPGRWLWYFLFSHGIILLVLLGAAC